MQPEFGSVPTERTPMRHMSHAAPLSSRLGHLRDRVEQCLRQPTHTRRYIQPGETGPGLSEGTTFTTPPVPMTERYCETESEAEAAAMTHLLNRRAFHEYREPRGVGRHGPVPGDARQWRRSGIFVRARDQSIGEDDEAAIRTADDYLHHMSNDWMTDSEEPDGSVRFFKPMRDVGDRLANGDTGRDDRNFIENVLIMNGLSRRGEPNAAARFGAYPLWPEDDHTTVHTVRAPSRHHADAFRDLFDVEDM
ncbi:hypothetical protein pmac_cds_437 [Pandoravirus macleodensis]|uniref:Uncharacterized protein n=1 Tax=Pandoravirus macleodensis TaxID=2107707 RepID=A0A2U7UFH7_9VIRU|nr:hypothetical protein pmac_cds_437 [Pandoravirus macleodensis]AVK77125.1 hypothetical protein pmac_cds_437 [Pandoravirus macleodensis]